MIIGIVAVDTANGIGIDGDLPWPRLKEDMAWFKSQTLNQIVLMGSNTWKSIGSKPLPNRINGVVSRRLKPSANYNFFTPEYGVEFFTKIFPNKTLFIIGGQQIYDSTLHYVDKWFVTHIKETYTTDKKFNLNYVIKNYPNQQVLNSFEKTETTPAYEILEYSR
jgi:dihydrofolate reductase